MNIEFDKNMTIRLVLAIALSSVCWQNALLAQERDEASFESDVTKVAAVLPESDEYKASFKNYLLNAEVDKHARSLTNHPSRFISKIGDVLRVRPDLKLSVFRCFANIARNDKYKEKQKLAATSLIYSRGVREEYEGLARQTLVELKKTASGAVLERIDRYSGELDTRAMKRSEIEKPFEFFTQRVTVDQNQEPDERLRQLQDAIRSAMKLLTEKQDVEFLKRHYDPFVAIGGSWRQGSMEDFSISFSIALDNEKDTNPDHLEGRPRRRSHFIKRFEGYLEEEPLWLFDGKVAKFPGIFSYWIFYEGEWRYSLTGVYPEDVRRIRNGLWAKPLEPLPGISKIKIKDLADAKIRLQSLRETQSAAIEAIDEYEIGEICKYTCSHYIMFPIILDATRGPAEGQERFRNQLKEMIKVQLAGEPTWLLNGQFAVFDQGERQAIHWMFYEGQWRWTR